ncbi:HK97 gp10 family phage protein [Actinosynnema mirum]|uniref:Uncharacterized protein n=1 Tax=Actinosynnema mirum (strain ATCC 29888 / DSM 43827 / JCM 3225 / NBRC 14064 / NCIMB 13271 / NRRL B-12336 / IMRU 3971 / 101) TaxID=446462 RepID=C6WC58_ACTMD|nr:HK97 gp10 family phage protein [Actinosynnema mirum]ACU39446.1 hypothetical protein Amir_5630 [Actinosynnema mirum DSM 43827]
MTVRVYVDAAQAQRVAVRASTPRRREIAAEIAAEARVEAPVRTGEYRDGIGVRSEGDRVFVEDSDPESIFKEYGTSDTPAHAVLTDAARQHGRYTGWKPK